MRFLLIAATALVLAACSNLPTREIASLQNSAQSGEFFCSKLSAQNESNMLDFVDKSCDPRLPMTIASPEKGKVICCTSR